MIPQWMLLGLYPSELNIYTCTPPTERSWMRVQADAETECWDRRDLFRELLMPDRQTLAWQVQAPAPQTERQQELWREEIKSHAVVVMEISSYNTSEEVGGFLAQACIQAFWFPGRRQGRGRNQDVQTSLPPLIQIHLPMWETLAPGALLARIPTMLRSNVCQYPWEKGQLQVL